MAITYVAMSTGRFGCASAALLLLLHGATASAAKSIEERREFANQQYQLGRKAFERGDLDRMALAPILETQHGEKAQAAGLGLGLG